MGINCSSSITVIGGKKIPELAKGLGSGIKNFKNAVKEDEEVAKSEKTDEIEKKAEPKSEETNENKTV